MRTKREQLILQIDQAIESKDYRRSLSLITEQPHIIFSVPNLNIIMGFLNSIPDEYFVSSLQKLLRAWTYFLCGDNYLLTRQIGELKEENFISAEESSLYYSLKALITFMNRNAEGLHYAKLSVDLLGESENIFYLANARLTYGQLLSSAYRAQEASVEFFAAYHLFKQLGSDFLSMVAIVNYGLKKHAMGQIRDIISIFSDEITANSRTSGESEVFLDTLKLPLGMAFFELNKPTTAVEYLESARKGIFSLDYVHMYGSVEPYLCFAYGILRKFGQAFSVLDELETRIGGLNSKPLEATTALTRTDLHLMEGTPPLKSDIELLEVHAFVGGKNALPSAILTLARLKLNGLSDAVGLNELLELEASLDGQERIPLQQSVSLLTAEFYYRADDLDNCQKALKKAIEIYNETRMCARFYLERLECFTLLKNLCPGLYEQASVPSQKSEVQDPLLTSRELEILAHISDGLSNEEIAKRLYISVGTTKWHINNIFSKLQIKRRSQAAAYYHQLVQTNARPS